jgi:hypothetical protein
MAMKLLFDENLAARLVGDLADVYPESAHVPMHGLGGSSKRGLCRWLAPIYVSA